MQDIMMVLGTYVFSIESASYQKLSRSVAYRWKNQTRMMARDALQFTGEGEDSITLTGVIYPNYKGGTGQLTVMRGLAGKGKPLILIDGKGFVHGLWIIEKIEEVVDAFFGKGVPKKQTFTMKIRKYGDLKSILENGLVESFISGVLDWL